MAISFDAASTISFVAATSASTTHTCTGTNRILFINAWQIGPVEIVTSVTYNGVGLTKVAFVANTDRGAGLWCLVNPATGANTLTINASLSSGIQGAAASYTGAKQTGVPDSSNTRASASGSPATVSTTTVADNSWLVAAFVNDTGNISAGTSTTIRAPGGSTTFGIYDSNAAKTPAGSFALATTNGGGNTAAVIASFAPVVASGPANLKSYDGNVKSNIKSMNGNLIANVKSFDGNS